MTDGIDLTNDALMNHEWEAWREVCDLLGIRKIDLNTDNHLAGALVKWGDRLAELRIYQETKKTAPR